MWWCECRYTPSTRGPWCPRRMADVCRRVAECNQSAADCRVKPRSQPIMATASTEPEGSCREAVPTSIYPESIIRVSRRRRDIPFLDPVWNQVRNEFTYRLTWGFRDLRAVNSVSRYLCLFHSHICSPELLKNTLVIYLSLKRLLIYYSI